jgi:hypothetical protein
MPDDAELRDEIRAAVRRHDPDPETLESIAGDLETLAEKWRDADEVL